MVGALDVATKIPFCFYFIFILIYQGPSDGRNSSSSSSVRFSSCQLNFTDFPWPLKATGFVAVWRGVRLSQRLSHQKASSAHVRGFDCFDVQEQNENPSSFTLLYTIHDKKGERWIPITV